MFDEEPEGDPHGQCAAEIHRLTEENERLRKALQLSSDGAGKVASKRFLFREYWNHEEDFRSYRNLLHSLGDDYLSQISQLGELMEAAGIKDGDEIEITVRATGNRPFPGRIWKHVGPHRYEPVERSATTNSETEH